jgi:hypothetical protein
MATFIAKAPGMFLRAAGPRLATFGKYAKVSAEPPLLHCTCVFSNFPKHKNMPTRVWVLTGTFIAYYFLFSFKNLNIVPVPVLIVDALF